MYSKLFAFASIRAATGEAYPSCTEMVKRRELGATLAHDACTPLRGSFLRAGWASRSRFAIIGSRRGGGSAAHVRLDPSRSVGQSMETNDRSMQFAGGALGRQRHICAFFNSVEEEHRVLGSFIKDGLDGG